MADFKLLYNHYYNEEQSKFRLSEAKYGQINKRANDRVNKIKEVFSDFYDKVSHSLNKRGYHKFLYTFKRTITPKANKKLYTDALIELYRFKFPNEPVRITRTADGYIVEVNPSKKEVPDFTVHPLGDIRQVYEIRNEKFNYTKRQYEILLNHAKINNIVDISLLYDILFRAITIVIDDSIRAGAIPEDSLMSLKLYNPLDGYNRTPVEFKLCQLSKFNAKLFLDRAEAVLQSWKDNGGFENLTLESFTLREPTGGNRTKNNKTINDRMKSMSLDIVNNPDDYLCLERSILIGYHFNNMKNNEEASKTSEDPNSFQEWLKIKEFYNAFRKHESPTQDKQAINLAKEVKHDPKKPAKLSLATKIEKVLECRVKILQTDGIVLYKGNEDITDESKFIYILYSVENDIGHYDHINNPRGFFGCKYSFCKTHDHIVNSAYGCPKCKANNCNMCGMPDVGDKHFKDWNQSRDLVKYNYKTNTCENCNQGMSKDDFFNSHAKQCKSMKMCPTCNNSFATDECLHYHLKDSCPCIKWKCLSCNAKFVVKDEFNRIKKSLFKEYIQTMSEEEAKEFLKDKEVDYALEQEEGESDSHYRQRKRLEIVENKHNCKHEYCSNCFEYAILEKHECYVQPFKPDPKKLDVKLLYYDFEAKKIEDGIQRVNHAQIINDYDQTTTKFWGENSLSDFMNYVIQQKHKDHVVVAHNGKGYDAILIREWALKHKITPYIIHQGGKVLMMLFKSLNIRFIDSLAFFQCPLKELPSMFGFEKEVRKGDFPHSYNTDKNMVDGYSCIHPPLEAYEPDRKKEKDKKALVEWYNMQDLSKPYYPKVEMENYCRDDVLVLRRACQEFRKLVLEITNNQINPFSKITLASLALDVYRAMFLPKNTIAVQKVTKLKKDMYSKKAINWLESIMAKENIHIRHARNDPNGEARIYKKDKKQFWKVDGYCESTNTVYEFQGCYWHGCPNHQNKDAKIQNSSMTMGERYEQTKIKGEEIKALGYKYVEQWECDTNISSVLEDYPTILNPRDSLFGGRTETVAIHHKIEEDEEILYYDFRSLYPTINAKGVYPVGHPHIARGKEEISLLIQQLDKNRIKTSKLINIMKEQTDIANVRGLIYCDVLPPNNLYHPVLPQVINNKLTFSLCKTCAQEQKITHCNHTPQERTFRGIWTHFELLKALEKGYKIVKLHEIHHFTEWAVDQGSVDKLKNGKNYVLPSVFFDLDIEKAEKEGHAQTYPGLFSGYVQTFLKLKTEAEAWDVDGEYLTDVAKSLSKLRRKNVDGSNNDLINKITKVDEEIKSIERVDGYKIDRSKLKTVKNPGMRSVAKLFLNSLWGKFGQRDSYTETEYIYSAQDLWKHVHSSTHSIEQITDINEDIMELVLKPNEEVLKDNVKSNIYLASFTTSMARLKLYDAIEKLGEKVLYMDTDSVIFVAKKGQTITDFDLPTSKYFLGDFSDELDSDYIVEFVSCGPKNYAYTTSKGKTTCKVKGFTLNVENSKVINLETMLDMIQTHGKPESTPTTSNFRIDFDKRNRELFAHITHKEYSFELDKRVIDWDKERTYPYGYIE